MPGGRVLPGRVRPGGGRQPFVHRRLALQGAACEEYAGVLLGGVFLDRAGALGTSTPRTSTPGTSTPGTSTPGPITSWDEYSSDEYSSESCLGGVLPGRHAPWAACSRGGVLPGPTRCSGEVPLGRVLPRGVLPGRVPQGGVLPGRVLPGRVLPRTRAAWRVRLGQVPVTHAPIRGTPRSTTLDARRDPAQRGECSGCTRQKTYTVTG